MNDNDSARLSRHSLSRSLRGGGGVAGLLRLLELSLCIRTIHTIAYHSTLDMFASPSFEASFPEEAAAAASASGDAVAAVNQADPEEDEEVPSDEDDEDAMDEHPEDDADTGMAEAPSADGGATATNLFPTGIELDDNDDNDEEEEEVEEDEDEDDDDPSANTTSPAGAGTTTAATTAPTTTTLPHQTSHVTIRAVPTLRHLSGERYREMGKEALCWQLSSAKPGNGVEQIRDRSTDTYWQSDGVKQPHWIQVSFKRRVALSHVCLYLDYGLDESYTPRRVSVHFGMTSQDLQPATTELEFQEPVGWCVVPLCAGPDPLDVYGGDGGANDDDKNNTTAPQQRQQCIRTHLLRISVLSMHQNGRDTHIRQCALYGPRQRGEAPQATAVLQRRRRGRGMTEETPQQDDDDDDDDDDMDWRPLSLSVGGVIR